jgi:hypothetical protein
VDVNVSEKYAASICNVKIYEEKNGLDGQEAFLSETLVSLYKTKPLYINPLATEFTFKF